MGVVIHDMGRIVAFTIIGVIHSDIDGHVVNIIIGDIKCWIFGSIGTVIANVDVIRVGIIYTVAIIAHITIRSINTIVGAIIDTNTIGTNISIVSTICDAICRTICGTIERNGSNQS